ncbi:MAG: hypothetical protein GTO41_26970 [Burkholderiales bacterium]|nr:hypothetical protein [Burkholderiales bacterium]
MRAVIFVLALVHSANGWAGGPGLSVKAGTLGAGLDVGWAFNESFDARVSLNRFSYDDTFTESNIEYDGDIDLATAGLLLDWHPFRGSFRLTAGAYANNNEVTASGKPTGGTFEINGVIYPASDIGSLGGVIEFDNISPYLGLGFGTLSKSVFKFTFDLGVLYQKPDSTLNVVCGITLTPAECSQLQSDVAAEQATLNEELDDYRYYPVLAIGIGWVF